MSGGEAEARTKGGNVVVGTVGFGLGGDADSCPGSGEDRGGRGDRRAGDCDGQLVKWGGYCSNHKRRDRD